MTKPVQKLGKSPLRRIHAATPVNCFHTLTMGGSRDFRRLTLGSMIAPQIVFAERLQILAYRNHRRAGGIKSDGLYLIPRNIGLPYRLPGGGGERAHVIFGSLCRGFRVIAFATERRFSCRCSE